MLAGTIRTYVVKGYEHITRGWDPSERFYWSARVAANITIQAPICILYNLWSAAFKTMFFLLKQFMFNVTQAGAGILFTADNIRFYGWNVNDCEVILLAVVYLALAAVIR